MAFTPVSERYTVEGGRIIHRILMQDENGRTTQTETDEGAAPPGTGEGQDIYNSDQAQGLTGNDASTGVTNPLAGTETPQARMAPLGADYSTQGPSGAFSPPSGLPYANQAFGGSPQNNAFGSLPGVRTGGSMANPNNPQYGPAATNAFMPGLSQPGAPGLSSAAPDAGGGAGNISGDDWQRAANLGRFSPDNPEMAMVQKMLDMGMQPFNKFNPFTQMIQRAATGLAAAFMIQNANNPGNVMGQGAQAPDTGNMFSSFLGNALGSGNVFSTLGSAASQLPQAVQAYRDSQAANGPGNVNQVNPFLQALGDMLSSQGFAGTTGMMASLLGPSMPRSLASGYAGGLEQALANATKGFWGQQAPTGGARGNDFMKYLMGI